MKLRFQIYVREYEVTRGKHQQQHVMMKETPANLIFHCRHYVNISVLLQKKGIETVQTHGKRHKCIVKFKDIYNFIT